MNACPPRFESAGSALQRGGALIISLIMLLVLTLLGVSTMSNLSLQERMAGSLIDRNHAFQAAETALRRAEEFVRNLEGAQSDLIDGQGVFNLANNDPQPAPDSFEDWEANFITAPDVGDALAGPPRYRIEIQPKDSDNQPTMYRFSALGFGRRDDTRVVLQASFVDPDF